MKQSAPLAAFIFLVTALLVSSWTTAQAAVTVVFGDSWDGPSNTLQSIIDARYGAGRLNVRTDYIGALTSDQDPFFWADQQFSALLIREIAGNAGRNILGWYMENSDGTAPVIDGVEDGVVFDGADAQGEVTVINFGRPLTKFGFYMNPNGTLGAINAPEPELFFTNRRFNDLGPTGSGALHSPWDGDVQALVYDVSEWTSPNTWLVCFEDVDSGAQPGPCCATTDNDFNDLVFEVSASGPTWAQPLTFGAVKVRYR